MRDQKKPKSGAGTFLLQKKNNPRVSVIIPTYNREYLLKNAIKSVLKQTFADFEIIVVDDGSTDDIQNTAKRMGDRRIKYFEKHHAGQPSALNVGLRQAKGDYICFCDDDDEYLPRKLEACLNFFKNNPKYDVCYSAFYFRLSNDKIIPKQFKHDDQFFLERLFSKGFLFINSMMFKKPVFSKVGGFNESIGIGNDYDLLLRIAALGKPFGYIDIPTVIYNKHSLSMTSDKKSMYSVILLLKDNFKTYKKTIAPYFRHIVLSNILFREGKYYFWQHDFQKARKLFMKSILTDPKNKRPYLFFPFTFLGMIFFNLCIYWYQKLTGNFYIRDCS